MDFTEPTGEGDDHHGGQERALFLLDARPELFEPTDQGTRCEIAVRQVLDYVKARLLEKNRDIVGLVACGPDEAAVTLLTPAAPSAKAARALGDALKRGACATPETFRKWLDDNDEITQKERNRTDARQGRLRNGLDRCARDLEDASKGPSAVDSIYIFSGAKDPCDGDSDQHAACEVFARDSSDVDRELQLYYFGEAEQVDDFWKPRILVPSSPPLDNKDQWQERAWPALEIVDVFDAGRERARMARGMRGAKTVPGVELTLALGDDTSTKVVVRLRKLHQCKRAQTATNVHGESLQRVKAQGDVLDTVTGAKLDKATDVNTYVAVGHFHEPPKEEDEPESAKALRRSHRVVVDAQDRDECAECFESGSVCVLGVCSVRDAFPSGLRVQNPGSSPCALSPDDSEAPGSSAVVQAFASSLREKNLVALARYIPKRSAARRRGPKLVALQARDDGLGLIELPFDDELRAVPSSDEVPPAPELDRSMSALVNALQARCMPGGPVDVDAGVPNYALRSQHAALEAFALGLDDSAVQKVKMRAEALRPSRGETELVTAAEAVAESLPEEIEEQPVAKKRRVAAPKDIKVLVDKALLTAPCDREKLKNHTNDALKACCGDLGLKKSGKKEDLVERIAEHVDAQSA